MFKKTIDKNKLKQLMYYSSKILFIYKTAFIDLKHFYKNTLFKFVFLVLQVIESLVLLTMQSYKYSWYLNFGFTCHLGDIYHFYDQTHLMLFDFFSYLESRQF